MTRVTAFYPPLGPHSTTASANKAIVNAALLGEWTAQSLSVVLPFYNEEENVLPMLAQIHGALKDFSLQWELIAIDDGSEDGTFNALKQAALIHGCHIRIIQLQRNFGQTAALQAGIEAARGTLIATLDGDLQNDPADIPCMAVKLIEEDLDLVAGWRYDRQDTLVQRKLPSWIANRLIGRVTGVHLHDYGCTLKVCRASVIKEARLLGEMHRFIPAWLSTVASTKRIAEVPVRHHAREHGHSKYGPSRVFRVVFDLLTVYFFMRFSARPGHFFGAIGLGLGVIGCVALGWLMFVKFALAESIGARPLLIAGVVCVIASVQMLTTGILAEMLIRLNPKRGSSYVIRNKINEAMRTSEDGWHRPRR